MTPNRAKDRVGGSIVVTVCRHLENTTDGQTSLGAIFGGMSSPAYTTSKWAATGLLKSTSAQFKHAGVNIRVNGVA
jgi:NAD(P)-dependent dehydrogenase (short-subunit alcohol dehydrogenase family)